MPITIKNSAGGGVTLDSSTSSNETINLNNPVFTGNVGVGVTPESWLSTYPAMQIGAAGCVIGSNDNSFVSLNGNAYVDSVNSRWEYVNSDYASQYQQYDGQHNWRVAPSGTADAPISWIDAMTINNAGIVTKPLQPAFQASATGHANVPISTWHEMALTEIFDTNSDFDASNNKFIAPVTGKYQLQINVRVDNFQEATVYMYVKIQTSNRQIYFLTSGNQMDSNMLYMNMGGSVITDMDANDESKIQYFIHGGAAVADINAETRFSGFLAC